MRKNVAKVAKVVAAGSKARGNGTKPDSQPANSTGGDDKKQNRHKRFQQLPADVKAELDSRVVHGVNLSDLASWLQEIGHFADMTHDVLVATLYRYRCDIQPTEVLNRELPSTGEVLKVLNDIGKDIDEVSELSRLYQVQLERIEIGALFERKSRVINRHMANEISTAADLLMRSHRIKGDLGLHRNRGVGVADDSAPLESHIRNRYDTETISAANSHLSRGKVMALLNVINELSDDGLTFEAETDDD
jgi:hypothetical protein